MNKFTVPEINFISIFLGDSKTETVANIMEGIPNFNGETELIEIAEQSIMKLDGITQTEFEAVNFNENFTDE